MAETEVSLTDYTTVCRLLAASSIPFAVDYPTKESAVFVIEKSLTAPQLKVVTDLHGVLGPGDTHDQGLVIRIIATAVLAHRG